MLRRPRFSVRHHLPVVLLALLTALQIGSACSNEVYYPTAAYAITCIEYRALPKWQKRYVKQYEPEVRAKDCFQLEHYRGFDIMQGNWQGKKWYFYDTRTYHLRILPLTTDYFKGGLLLEPLPGPLLDSIGGRHDTARVREFQRFLREEYDHQGKPILLR